MILTKLITLTGADPWNRLRFTAMERSLRATGCELPLFVIPYNDTRFSLPANSTWLVNEELNGWLGSHQANNLTRKYLCLTEENYHFIDTDVIFLRNPGVVLQTHQGFVTSCGHWNNPPTTYTEESLRIFKEKTTTWQKSVFNVGQFACDRRLYSLNQLKETARSDRFYNTCLRYSKFSDQVGLNLLVQQSNVPVMNLQLPPLHMESTWAGDYEGDDYEQYWTNEITKPYLMHWAGINMSRQMPIHALFYHFLTGPEKKEWADQVTLRYAKEPVKKKYGLLHPLAVGVKKISQMIIPGK